jgi:hypothetical protein
MANTSAQVVPPAELLDRVRDWGRWFSQAATLD